MGKTKKPSGMKATRSGNNIVFTWKIGDKNYGKGQRYARIINYSKNVYDAKLKKNVYKGNKNSTSGKIGTKDTRYTVTINPNSYYPKTQTLLTSVRLGISGKYGSNSWSDWTALTRNINKPNAPTVSASFDSTFDNRSNFSWDSKRANTLFEWFTDFERETIFIQDCNTSDGSKVNWSGAKKYTGSAISHTIDEETPFQGYYSYTRWYRVRARGPRGNSDWRYARHVYAMPAYANIIESKVEAGDISRGYYRVNVKWKADATIAHPIDSTSIEYLVTKPDTKVSVLKDSNDIQYSHVELLPPSMSGGTTVSTVKDTTGEDGIVFSVPAVSSEDNCIVVRVNTKHDNNTSTGATTYVDNSFGQLKNPTITSIGTVDPETKRVSLSIDNNSEVPNSHVAIFYKHEDDPDKEYCVGIIPYGRSSAVVILPDSCSNGNFTIGAQTRLGDYSPVAPKENEVTYYTLTNNLISSDTLWDTSSVPLPPQNITLTTPKVGTIRVMWDWSWQQATGAELSWSQNEDAWESTEDPQTYIVENTKAGAWNIKNLDIGLWYVRIRLFREVGESIIYGSYSDPVSIKLSSAPAIPSLTLSESVISKDGSVTCYWVYTTTDGTNQMNAEICECQQQEDGSFSYGEVIARATSAQSITINAEDHGWEYGETHYLAVRVTSESGETSDDWSVPQSLAIAESINIGIKSTSLITISEVVGEGEDQTTYTYKALDAMPLSIEVGTLDMYDLSVDPSVVDGKVYYVRKGKGTEEEPYYYEIAPTFIADPSPYYEKEVTPNVVNPSEFGYYEESDLEYSETEDITWNYTKTYYTQIIVPNIVNPHDLGYYEDIDSEYVLTEDRVWDYEKTYYVYSDGSYIEVDAPPEELYSYEVVPAPPEEIIEYLLTTDTTWDDTKDYYLRSGDGTAEVPYIYSIISKPVEDPIALKYYEPKTIEGNVILAIERSEPYHVDRPDETEFDGFDGETIVLISQQNDGSITINDEDLIGLFDDGANYRIVVSLKDSYGQVANAESLDFTVKWAHQAIIPEAEVEVFTDELYTTIVAKTPIGYELTIDTEVLQDKSYYIRSGDGTDEDPYVYTLVDNPSGNPKDQGYYQDYNSLNDRCDIYRLSVDSPELIVSDALFETKYVDPYPTLNTFGGYRVVYKTVNGDYITPDNLFAWTDYIDPKEHQIELFATIIDFDEERIILPYDISLSSKWSKDFTETKYLGGSVQGDWNTAVSRTGTVSTDTVVFEDPDTIKAMRRLADFAGICHVRTPDGSNFCANVNVSESRDNKFVNKLAKFSLDITRVDNESIDGELYSVWKIEDE